MLLVLATSTSFLMSVLLVDYLFTLATEEPSFAGTGKVAGSTPREGEQDTPILVIPSEGSRRMRNPYIFECVNRNALFVFLLVSS